MVLFVKRPSLHANDPDRSIRISPGGIVRPSDLGAAEGSPAAIDPSTYGFFLAPTWRHDAADCKVERFNRCNPPAFSGLPRRKPSFSDQSRGVPEFPRYLTQGMDTNHV
jgi:hypothetical protein